METKDRLVSFFIPLSFKKWVKLYSSSFLLQSLIHTLHKIVVWYEGFFFIDFLDIDKLMNLVLFKWLLSMLVNVQILIKTKKIFSTCTHKLKWKVTLTSLEPANRGSPVCISTKIHPRLHISMARSYAIPNNTSGDR